MRWVSNKESVRKGEPSVLAIAETLIAMGLTLWIAVHFGTVKHVVIGACIAPFLLLRTDESATFGIRVSEWAFDRCDELPDKVAWLLFLPLLLMFMPIRVLATIVSVIRSPTAVARAIPGNWRRITVATDSCCSPQILPLPDDPAAIGQLLVDVDSYDLYHLVGRSVLTDSGWMWKRSVGLAVIAIPGLPAMLYRWSLKSTAIIWFPLLWALQPIGPSNEPLKVRLRLFEKSDLFRIVLVVSAAALLLFVIKLILYNVLAQASKTWDVSIGDRTLTVLDESLGVGWWQLVTALNSAIAIGLWLYVRSWLRHEEAGVACRETVVESLLAWGLFVRRLLTSYTIPCLLYWWVAVLRNWEFPPLGDKL